MSVPTAPQRVDEGGDGAAPVPRQQRVGAVDDGPTVRAASPPSPVVDVGAERRAGCGPTGSPALGRYSSWKIDQIWARGVTSPPSVSVRACV